MAKLLLRLGPYVPEDEAEEVRDLLRQHRIEFYETRTSALGMMPGGLWVRDDDEVAEARRLMAGYQQERQHRAREEQEAARRGGTAETFATVLKRDPVRVIVVLLGIAVVVAATLSLPWFLSR